MNDLNLSGASNDATSPTSVALDADWGIFTSRRFCPVCETEFKGQDLIPRVIVGLGILTGALGVGSYMKSGTAPANSLVTNGFDSARVWLKADR